jgi:murein DD-endopeptidase MepM/ murein hydrolase activator NlpD
MSKGSKISPLILGVILSLFSTNAFSQTTATVDITNPADGEIVRETVAIQAEVSVSCAFLQTPTPEPRISGFGMRGGRLHQGVDTADPQGIPVEAVMRGTAAVIGYSGNTGYTLGSGRRYGYHLHFGVWDTGGAAGIGPWNVWDARIGRPYAVNPDNYLPTARIRGKECY